MKIVYKIRLERKWIQIGPIGINEKSFFLTPIKIYNTLNVRRIKKCLNKVWEWRMKIEIKIWPSNKDFSCMFNNYDSGNYTTLIISKQFVLYSSVNYDLDIDFDTSLSTQTYNTRNIRILTDISQKYFKKLKNLKRNLFKNTGLVPLERLK